MNILTGINDNQQYISSIDYCGKNVLGMGGSLLNYINTGNPGSDTFSNSKKVQTKKAKAKLIDGIKIATIITALLAMLKCVFKFKK